MSATSPAAVVMFAAPGRIRLVPLCVSVRMLSNTSRRRVPACIVPSAVIVVVPVTCANGVVTVERSVVDAEAILLDFDSGKSANACGDVFLSTPDCVHGIDSVPVRVAVALSAQRAIK